MSWEHVVTAAVAAAVTGTINAVLSTLSRRSDERGHRRIESKLDLVLNGRQLQAMKDRGEA